MFNKIILSVKKNFFFQVHSKDFKNLVLQKMTVLSFLSSIVYSFLNDIIIHKYLALAINIWRDIGVSNFTVNHLKKLLKNPEVTIIPAVNQVFINDIAFTVNHLKKLLKNPEVTIIPAVNQVFINDIAFTINHLKKLIKNPEVTIIPAGNQVFINDIAFTVNHLKKLLKNP